MEDDPFPPLEKSIYKRLDDAESAILELKSQFKDTLSANTWWNSSESPLSKKYFETERQLSKLRSKLKTILMTLICSLVVILFACMILYTITYNTISGVQSQLQYIGPDLYQCPTEATHGGGSIRQTLDPCTAGARHCSPLRFDLAWHLDARGLANLFSPILDIAPRLFQPIEQKGGVGLHGLFRLVDSRRGAVVSPPTHPPRLCYVRNLQSRPQPRACPSA